MEGLFQPGVRTETQNIAPNTAMINSIEGESALLDSKTRDKLGQQIAEKGLDVRRTWEQLREHYKLVEREGSLNGHHIDFVGVFHTPETLLFERQRLEEAIKKAGVIVLEGAPEIAGIYDENFKNELRQAYLNRGLSVEQAQQKVSGSVDDNRFNLFFHEMEQMAKKYGKPVVTADPDSGAEEMPELLRAWAAGRQNDLREAADEAQLLFVVGWGTSLLGGVGALGLGAQQQNSARMSAPYTEEEKKKELPNKSRRNFLQGAAAVSVAAALSPVVIGGIANQDHSSVPRSLVAYDFIDFRNVAVARGIDAVTKERPPKGPIVFIYGSAHTDTMLNYLKHPDIREMKYQLYKPLRSSRNPVFGEYEYGKDPGNEESYSWRQTVRKEI